MGREELAGINTQSINKKRLDFTGDIIVIDDDDDDKARIKSIFQNIDPKQNVRLFSNGDEFINSVHGQDCFWFEDSDLGLPRLILVDVHMPIKNGIQTIAIIRSKPLWSSVPIILLTGTDDDCKINQAYDLGTNAFLPKPFKRSELIQAMYKGFNFASTSI